MDRNTAGNKPEKSVNFLLILSLAKQHRQMVTYIKIIKKAEQFFVHGTCTEWILQRGGFTTCKRMISLKVTLNKSWYGLKV